MYKKLIFSTMLFGLMACGGSNSTSDLSQFTGSSAQTLTGQFIDSAVEGLHYETESQQGNTNERGEFNYRPGENIIFSIGSIIFPSTPVNRVITPLDIFQTNDINNLSVVNMLRLLQSLDADGNADNGIKILQIVHTLAQGLSIDFAATDFSGSGFTNSIFSVSSGGMYSGSSSMFV